MMREIPSRIDFKEAEKEILKKYGERIFYIKEKDLNNKKRFCIIMPPPNANGELHLGHALFLSLQDAMIRYFRLKGYTSFWLPGFDHAGFETQVVIEKRLAKEGKSRFDYSAEEFYQLINKFVEENKKKIRSQMQSMWVSADWSKERYTLDKGVIDFVYYVFEKLYNEGLIYKSLRPINFCLHHQTGFSDLEVNYKEEKGRLYFLKYYLKDSQEFLTVATTRPETIFADVALAINPKDKRYKSYLNKKALIPLINKEIPIIADNLVDPNFGTGVLKITPAHDFTDWLIAQKHKIQNYPSIINIDGRLNEQAYFLKGLKIEEAKNVILEKLKNEGYLVKEEEYLHKVPICYKCENKIEIIPTEQWFLKMKPLAELAIKAIQKGEIKFIPEYGKKRIINWLKEIQDWNITRQIIWGIPLPVYSCENGHLNVSKNKLKACRFCRSKNLQRENHVFDTWFSSSLWPVVTLLLSGKKIKKKKEKLPFTSTYFESFYPTTVMETGHDILYFWVARMIMFGLYLTGKVPFKIVYLHGIIRDEKGEKMSKSKGNVINPDEVIKDYGVDSLRISLLMNNPPGEDLRYSWEKVIGARNFINKVWNIARFIALNCPKKILKNPKKPKPKTQSDKMILNEEKKMFTNYFKYMDNLEIYKALNVAYFYSWRKLADIYLEKSKEQLKDKKLKKNTQMMLAYLLNNLLKILNPFMPITTEYINLKIVGNKKPVSLQRF